MRPLLIFDMDGVLVDVSESYRVAIEQTVAHFSGVRVSNEQIQDYKNQGGWNDDWALSHRMIQDAGREARYDDVVAYFQAVFHGDGDGGLMRREKWIAGAGLIERLSRDYTLAVFTGRLHWEADLTIARFAPGCFTKVVGVDDVLHAKPAPEGILQIRDAIPHDRVWYVGDSVDDARAGATAKVPFIGIAAPGSPRPAELAQLLLREGAFTVLDDINRIGEALR